jgi:hypothetical protein
MENASEGARYPSGKGEVCKTFIRRFDPDPRLQSQLLQSQDALPAVYLLTESGQAVFSSSIENPGLYETGLFISSSAIKRIVTCGLASFASPGIRARFGARGSHSKNVNFVPFA